MTMNISDRAATAGKWLNLFSWLVALAGIVLAGISIWAGFASVEPWVWHGVTVEEEWISCSLGFVGAGVDLVVAGAVWALLQLSSAYAAHLAGKYKG